MNALPRLSQRGAGARLWTFASLAPLMIALGALLLATPARAQYQWNGQDYYSIGNMSYTDNWYGNSVPYSFGFGNDLEFNYNQGRIGAETSIYDDFTSWYNVNNIYFESTFSDSSGISWTSAGDGFNFSNKVENDSTGTVSISTPLSGGYNFASNIQLNPVGGNLIISGAIFNDFNEPYQVWAGSGKTLTLNTGLAGSSTASFTLETLGGNAVMNAANTYQGSTTVDAGTLTANAAGALGNTSGITVDSSGTLILAASGAAGSSVGVTLDGGTLMRNGSGVSEGTGGSSPAAGLGTLTLNGNSTLDFGTTGSGVMVFSGFDDISGTLNVLDDGSGDALIFDAYVTSTDFTFNGATAAQEMEIGATGYYELSAVPEPGSVFAALALVAAVGCRERRRLLSLVRFAKRTA